MRSTIHASNITIHLITVWEAPASDLHLYQRSLGAFQSALRQRTHLGEPVLSAAFDMSASSVLDTQRQLENLDPSNAQYQPLLHELLSHQDLKPHIQGLHGPDLEEFVELLDRVGETNVDTRRQCLPVPIRRSATFQSPTISSGRPCADSKASAAAATSCQDPTSFRAKDFRRDR